MSFVDELGEGVESLPKFTGDPARDERGETPFASSVGAGLLLKVDVSSFLYVGGGLSIGLVGEVQ